MPTRRSSPAIAAGWMEFAGDRACRQPVGVYGIRAIAELLENRFRLLWQGRRSALPRHQTLQAMLGLS